MAITEARRVLEAGIAAARTGDRSQARQLLVEAVRQDPNNEQGWLWLAGVVDRPEETVHCLEQALVLNPSNQAARQGIAWARQRLSPPKPVAPPVPAAAGPAPASTPPPSRASASALKSTFTTPPKWSDAVATLSAPREEETLAARLVTGKVSLPRWEVRGLASLRSLETVEEMVARGKSVMEQGRIDEAADIFRGAISRQPDQAEAHAQLAVARYQQGDKQGALVEFENAIAINPNYAESHYSLGLVYEELGETKAAAACWERVLQLNPNHAEARRSLEAARAHMTEKSRYKCPKCGTPLSGLEPSCPKCGEKLFARCLNCGEYVEEKEGTCPRCGTSLKKKPILKAEVKPAEETPEEVRGPQIACLHCGSLNPAYHTRCTICGMPIGAEDRNNSKASSRGKGQASAATLPKPRRRLRFTWLLIGLVSWMAACMLCASGSYAGYQIVPLVLADLHSPDLLSVPGDVLMRRIGDSQLVIVTLGVSLLLLFVGLIGFRRVRSR